MTFNPPYSVYGETGKALDASWRTLETIGIHAATLSAKSLDVDTLSFTMRAKSGRAIPDDGQWISLKDNTGAVLLTGIAKRTLIFPQMLYQFSVVNVYQGLMDTPLTDTTGKAYLLYDMADLGVTLKSILQHSHDLGLPIQAPATVPALMVVPKMGFRAASCGSALEDALKWAPDVASKMDYTTTPPTLRFTSRVPASALVIDLDTPGHGVTTMQLTAMPEARALYISFVYAVRSGALIVNYLTQSAGDPTADANRQMSIYLSGHDRTEMLVSEALVSSSNALATAQASLAAANAAVTAVNAQISATYAATLAAIPSLPSGGFNATAYASAHDTALATGTTAGVSWQTSNVGLWNTTSINGTNPGGSIVYSNVAGLFYATAAAPSTHISAPAGVCPPGTYTDAQLTAAGVTKTSGLIVGQMMFHKPSSGNHGYATILSGWTTNIHTSQASADADWQSWQYATLAGTPVDFLSQSLVSINNYLAQLAATAATGVSPGSGTTSFIAAAEFVEAPTDLALHYFNRQDWTPYKGQLTLSPTAPHIPMPGDFVSITSSALPTDYGAMATPVAEMLIDLETGASIVTLGPPARMTFASIQDRLRIPPEDNYQPG